MMHSFFGPSLSCVREKSRRVLRRVAGFTLVEMSVVLIIIALLTGGGLFVGLNIIRSTKITAVQEELATIQEALENYVTINGFLPCAASRVADMDTADFGEEAPDCTVAIGGGGTVVDASPLAGTSTYTDIHIGALPTKQLGLPASAAIDPWGSRYLYVVSSGQAIDAATYEDATDGVGTIFVITPGAASATMYYTGVNLQDPFNAGYVVLSHGPDREGAYTAETGVLAEACNTGNADVRNTGNCDNNEIFYAYPYNDGDVAANFFDDFIVWGTKKENAQNPVGVVRQATITYWQDVGPVSVDGDFADISTLTDGGVQGGNTFCKDKTGNTDARMATLDDLYIAGTLVYPTANAWIGGLGGNWGGTAVNECLGWTSSSNAHRGGAITSTGAISIDACNITNYITCYEP